MLWRISSAICPEVISNRPWNFQIDLFGIAGTILKLLTGSKLALVMRDSLWATNVTFPRSYKSQTVWETLFEKFPNIPDCNSLPNLPSHRPELEKIFLKEFQLDEIFRP